MLTALGALSAALCAADMPRATPESQGVSSQAIIDWLDACNAEMKYMHGFVVVRHGKVIAEGAWAPFDPLTRPHMLYSHSKSFTSTAIGFLADEGKVDLDERIADIFADKMPTNPPPELLEVRVRDLLTMNFGSDASHAPKCNFALADWEKGILSRPMERRPGTKHRYDSDATYLLSCIVERKSGMRTMDYLKAKLFDPLGMTSPWSTGSPSGTACGGWGMNMTTRDIARFGQLYLQQGRWGGEYVLSPSWVVLATTRHTWSGWSNIGVKALGEGSDWEQGYGFQFWRCRHGAYRADGASGQLTVVLPECDMVVSINAGLRDMQKELALIWDNLLPGVKDAPLVAGEALACLRRRIDALAIPPTAGGSAGLDGFLGKAYGFKSNHRGIESARFEKDGGNLVCILKVPAGEQKIPVGIGEWKKGEMRFDVQDYEFLGAYVGVHRTAASAGIGADGTLSARIYLTGDTGYIDLSVSPAKGASGDFFAMNGTKLVPSEN